MDGQSFPPLDEPLAWWGHRACGVPARVPAGGTSYTSDMVTPYVAPLLRGADGASAPSLPSANLRALDFALADNYFPAMKVSGFTFLRNAQKLGYPFVESIRSILPIVDEFVIALGPSEDETEAKIRAIGDPKIRIIHTQWNERIRGDVRVKGFVYGQQKSIALFNCTGDWAFYLEGDEVLHEDDLPKIQEAMRKHLDNLQVEALYFDYVHFYGNRNTRTWCPGWYRTAPRILRNTIPAWAPKGLFFIVLDTQKKGRYPKAASANARIFHYGYVRSAEQMALKNATVHKFFRQDDWDFKYSEIDSYILKPFPGTHPKVMEEWLPPAEGLYQPNPNHKLTTSEIRHRIMLKIEGWIGAEFSHKHYKRVA